MFTSHSVQTIRSHLRGRGQPVEKYEGVSRRAISLMPPPQPSVDNVRMFNNKSDWSRLSLAIEASQRSGCLVVESEKAKSRSAMLIFRGRILSCMYGKKNLGSHLFGNQAFQAAVQDVKISAEKVDVYQLPDDLVVAAAALFHGSILTVEASDSRPAFEAALNQLLRSHRPGCIVITGIKLPTACTVYVNGGRIIGLHCNKRGWLEPSERGAAQYLAKNRDVSVQACVFPCVNIVEVLGHTFSLTGLDTDNWESLTPVRAEPPRATFDDLKNCIDAPSSN